MTYGQDIVHPFRCRYRLTFEEIPPIFHLLTENREISSKGCLFFITAPTDPVTGHATDKISGFPGGGKPDGLRRDENRLSEKCGFFHSGVDMNAQEARSVRGGSNPAANGKKQELRIQIGNCIDPINAVLIRLIQKTAKDDYSLKIHSSCQGEELIQLAEDGEIDIFILIINNIQFRHEDRIQDRLEKSVQLIARIKEISGKPLMALSGCENDPSLISRAGLAADFYFPLPFEPAFFTEAFEKCIRMIPVSSPPHS